MMPKNLMVHSGGIASLDGVTCEGVGSRRYFENKKVKLESKTVEILDEKVMYELHLPANYYRAKIILSPHPLSPLQPCASAHSRVQNVRWILY